MTTFYYDPQLDVHHRLPVSSAVVTSYYAAPQVPDDARRLFGAACTSMGLDQDLALPLRGCPGLSLGAHPGQGMGDAGVGRSVDGRHRAVL